MTDEQAALVERLEITAADMQGNWDGELDSYAELVLEAAATITALQARVDRLETGLRNIANNPYQYGQRVQMLKRLARATLGDVT